MAAAWRYLTWTNARRPLPSLVVIPRISREAVGQAGSVSAESGGEGLLEGKGGGDDLGGSHGGGVTGVPVRVQVPGQRPAEGGGYRGQVVGLRKTLAVTG
jgi:hypothetical protein